MKRFLLFTITATLCLLAANAFAQGATDKVTGTYTRANCFGCQPGDELKFMSYRWLNAKEASAKHPQKGTMFALNDKGYWFELDFTDTVNTCVKIYEDGRARIGGVVQYANGPQIGRAENFSLINLSEKTVSNSSKHFLIISIRFSCRRQAKPVEGNYKKIIPGGQWRKITFNIC